MALRIGRAVRRANEDTYADSDDFPTRFGEKIQWLPTCICVLMMNCQGGLLTKHLPEHVLLRFNLVVSKRSDAVLHHSLPPLRL